MSDLNKPVKVTHDPETGEIISIENRQIAKADEIIARMRQTEPMETPQEYMDRTNRELRQMAIDEEDASKREKSFIEKQTDAIMARVTAPKEPANYGEYYETPKPATPKPSEAHIKRTTRSVQDFSRSMKKVKKAAAPVVTAFKELGEKIGEVKKDYHEDPNAPLTYRPFHTKALTQLREQLAKNS
jgi:hypothetical protein